MATINHRKFKAAEINLGTTDYSAQVMSTTPSNNTGDSEKVFTFAADGTGEFEEPADDDWQVTLKFLQDWTPTGISRYIATHDGDEVACAITFDPGVENWERTWTGTVTIRRPGDGGDAGSRQETELTLKYKGVPTLAFADEEGP